jgi:hypothetical protein
MMLGDHCGEAEYLVDRRRLSSVEVVERASELSPEEFMAMRKRER